VPQFSVTFHVEEDSIGDAQNWLNLAKQILTANRELLVSKSTNKGSWCEGHVAEASQQPVNNTPPESLRLGPRE